METKRCVYCHKLQRADTQICSRCGHAFVQKKTRSSMRQWTQPSIPPASPHRVGHYSGLHPEDQPYQSNKIAVQHPLPQESESWHTSLPEPEHIILPVTNPAIRRRVNIPEYYDERSAEELSAIQEPFFYTPRKGFLPRRAIPVLLAISCIFFLLASSILAVVLIRRSTSTSSARITAFPSLLRANDVLTLSGSGFSTHSQVIFTYDMNRTLLDGNKHALAFQTGKQGIFSVQLRIPGDWGIGQHTVHAIDESDRLSVSTTVTVEQPPTTPPDLQLSASNITFAAAASGAISDKMISLINSGGGQIVWRLSSDQSWLTASPGNGVFSGREGVHIMVNRSALAPASYTGHVTFIPENESSSTSLTLTITMGVEAVSSMLTISPATLPFTMSVGQQSVLKAIILQNNSNQSLNWSATASTTDQGHWLSAQPPSGTLGPGVEGFMNAGVNVQGLQPGSYQGMLILSDGSSGATQQVTIMLTVS